MQQNPEEILKQFEKFVKDNVQINFTSLHNSFQSKINNFQRIVNELKIYLAKQQDQLSLPIELWNEFKNKLVNIHEWTNLIENLLDDISLKNIHTNWNDKFEEHIKSISLRNMDFKWQEKMVLNEKQILNGILEDYLNRFGY